MCRSAKVHHGCNCTVDGLSCEFKARMCKRSCVLQVWLLSMHEYVHAELYINTSMYTGSLTFGSCSSPGVACLLQLSKSHSKKKGFSTIGRPTDPFDENLIWGLHWRVPSMETPHKPEPLDYPKPFLGILMC